jgi:hypothetical protein
MPKLADLAFDPRFDLNRLTARIPNNHELLRTNRT